MLNDKLCILLVDDEEKIVRALGDYYSARKYEVLKAMTVRKLLMYIIKT